MNRLLFVVSLGGFLLGVCLLLIAQVWVTVLAFKESKSWGLTCLMLPLVLLPFVAIYYALTEPGSLKPLILTASGVVLCFLWALS